MAIVLSDDQVRWLRLRAQGLDARRAAVRAALDPTTTLDAVTAVTTALCGIQAQYLASAVLAVRARAVDLVTAADVESALVEERTIVRTWLMRGTLHLIARQCLNWLPLLGPRMLANDQRRRTQLGLDDAICERALPLVQEALVTHSPLTRRELADALAPHGVPTAGQAMPHLLYYTAFKGLICFGPDQDGEPTYVLLDQWLGQIFAVTPCPDVPEEMKLTSLAIRYVHAYGPARPEDFASWAGMPVSLARATWSLLLRMPGLVEVAVGGRPIWIATAHTHWLDELDSRSERTPVVNLIPAYDPYLLGYQDRELVVAPEHAQRIHPGGGVLHNVLLVDGRALGIWRTARRRDRLEVIVEPFAPLTPDITTGLEIETADLGRFYETRAELVLRHPD